MTVAGRWRPLWLTLIVVALLVLAWWPGQQTSQQVADYKPQVAVLYDQASSEQRALREHANDINNRFHERHEWRVVSEERAQWLIRVSIAQHDNKLYLSADISATEAPQQRLERIEVEGDRAVISELHQRFVAAIRDQVINFHQQRLQAQKVTPDTV
ncbi:hypothetical protein [Idiomarina xiamenensis]|uniref:Signaling protein n=1 Tax=Idiomarina xiamenensis 10-D-4 TaxID=740709 RepID=K2KAW4_9GAMM|nr:hypothetical protein [Idiomarina xiamenensis]EKE83662.1 hypothetical protein A10D4_07435 [Idiomarina xiamenensis 10-D-4]